MPLHSQTAKSQKVGILTETGFSKLEQGIKQKFQSQNLHASYRKIAEQSALSTETVIQILYRQRNSDLKGIQALYKAFGLRLQREDYQILRGNEGEEVSFATPEDCTLNPGYQGREGAIAQLKTALQTSPLVQVTGVSGIGKTTLLQHFLADPQIQEQFAHKIVLDGEQQSGGFIPLLRQVLGETIALQLLTQVSLQEQVEQVVQKLQDNTILLILDHLEHGWDRETGQFQEAGLTLFFEQVQRCSDLPSRIIGVTPEPIGKDSVPCVALEGLSLEAMQLLFEHWGIPVAGEAEQNCLQEMIRLYAGHPLTLKIIAGEIRSAPYYGNIRAYWHDYGYEYELATRESEGPENLTEWLQTHLEQVIQRLNGLSPLTYELLCLGSVNPKAADLRAWQFLIGDFPVAEQEAAILTLKQRFFLEARTQDPQVRYTLHKFLRHIVGLSIPDLQAKEV